MSDESTVETTAEGTDARPAADSLEDRARALFERVRPRFPGLEAARAWLPLAVGEPAASWKYVGLGWVADLAERLVHALEQIAELEAEFDAQGDEVERLRKEVATLKGQNTKLRRRIAELEADDAAGEA